MKNLSFKTLAPYLAAIVIFLVITMAFFSPMMEGKKLVQSDIINFQGASKEIADYRAKTGEEALWTNSMFGGMPAYQISVNYTSNLIGYLDKLFTLGLPHPANLVFLYFIGFFILMLVLKIDPWLSIAGAIGFGFSSFYIIIIDAGHNSQAHAIGYLAPLLAGILLTLRKKYLTGGVLTAIFFSLELKMNHPQITYYFMMVLALIGIAECIEAVRKKQVGSFLMSVGVVAIAGIFAILTNITNIWTTYEYSKYTIRGKTELTTEKENRTSGLDKDYATQWSYGVGETMTLLIPDFAGGSSNEKAGEHSAVVKVLRDNNIPEETIRHFIDEPAVPMYWGSQPFTSGPFYVGAIIVFLFILGMIIVKGPLKWALLGATILSVGLSWGHNFMTLTDLFFSYVPGYNKFRTVSMTLVIAELTMPVLGMLAVKEIFNRSKDPKKLFNALKIAFGIAGGLTLLFSVFPGLFLTFTGPSDHYLAKQYPDWLMNAIREDRQTVLRMDAIRSFVLILLTGVLLWAFIFDKLKKQYCFAGLILLILIDLYTVDKRYLNESSFSSKTLAATPFEATRADEQILRDKDPDFRVLNVTVNPFTDASTSYYHKSIGGYHGAKLRRYQELFDEQISKNNMTVVNMLNTKYFIVPDNEKRPVAQLNPDALGHAWFVKGYKLVDNADLELLSLTNFNPKDTAIIDKRFSGELQSFNNQRDSVGFIRLDEYRPNRLDYTYRTAVNGLAVFSEIYYSDGWNAYLDGQLKPHFRANYVLRSMVLQAGEHKVVFKFEPKAYYTGEKISLASSLVLIVLLILAGFIEVRRTMRAKK